MISYFSKSKPDPVEFERAAKTRLACLLRFSDAVPAAGDLDFAVSEVAAAAALRERLLLDLAPP